MSSAPTAAAALLLSLTTFGAATAGLPETVERVKPSIVAVGTFEKTRSPAFAFRGTGFVVGDGTLVATNAHVVPESVQAAKSEKIVALASGSGGREPQLREATVLAVDKDHDLALLRISGTPLPAMALGDPTSVHEGQTYAFTGFPIGSVLGFVPVTHRGMIAAITPIVMPGARAQQLDARVVRRLQDGAFSVFQLDATAYPGNSGSPLYDLETGSVIAILNMVFVKGTKEAMLSQPSGISFAIPIRYLQEMLNNAK